MKAQDTERIEKSNKKILIRWRLNKNAYILTERKSLIRRH